MNKVKLNGKWFDYVLEGSGESVVHVLGMEQSYAPGPMGPTIPMPGVTKQLNEDHFRVIIYNNYEGMLPDENMPVTRAYTADSTNAVASECFSLLENLGVRRAHFFAHANVASVPFRLALDYPGLVHSIALLEMEIAPFSSLGQKASGMQQKIVAAAVQSPQFRAKLEELRSKSKNYEPGKKGATEIMMDKYGAAGSPVSDVTQFQLRYKITTLLGASPEDLKDRLKQPILYALWDTSQPGAKQSAELLKQWLPQTESYTVPKHFLPWNAKDLAVGLADFFKRHPMN